MKVSPVHPYIIGTAAKDHTIRLWTLDSRSKTQPTIAICGGEGGHRESVLTMVFHLSAASLISRHSIVIHFTCFQEVWTMQYVCGYAPFYIKLLHVFPLHQMPSELQQIFQNDIPSHISSQQQFIQTMSTA